MNYCEKCGSNREFAEAVADSRRVILAAMRQQRRVIVDTMCDHALRAVAQLIHEGLLLDGEMVINNRPRFALSITEKGMAASVTASE